MEDIAQTYLSEKFPFRILCSHLTLKKDNALFRRIALAYEQSIHNPFDPEVYEAYKALKNEISLQYEFMIENGIKVLPWVKPGQPYKNSDDLFEKFSKSKTLYIYLTRLGYGDLTEEIHKDHPMLDDCGISVESEKFCYNDLLRACHDYYAHYCHRLTFSLVDECRTAYRHMEFLSSEASKALFSEVVGQICFFYYGSHLQNKNLQYPEKSSVEYVPPALRPYSEQKAVILPKAIRLQFTQMFHQA